MRLPIFQGFAGSLSKTAPRSALLSMALLGAVALTSCAEHKIVEENYNVQRDQAQQALDRIAPKQPLSQALTIDRSPYYGSIATPITNGSPLPPEYEHPGALVMTFARPVTMPELARMIQAVTGLRASASGSSSSSGEQSGGATFMPSDGEEVAGGRVVWQGRLSALLDQAADSFGADWRYDGTTIQFAQAVTRTFMLHALASELSVSGSVSSGSEGEGGSNLPKVDVTDSASMKVWDEIKEAVGTIMGDAGKAAFSPSTGTITVTGSPDTVRRVESYLNQQNAMRLRRVAVAIKIISVTAENDFDLESDLTGIIRRVFDHASLRTVGDAAGGLAIGILKRPIGVEDFTPGDGSDGDLIQSDRLISELRANKGIEKAATTHSGALVTLSDQPAPLQVGRQISYLARTSATTGDTGGSVSLEPGTVNAGLMMTILPRIVEQNRILMRVSVAITDVPEIRQFGVGDNQIQLPQVDTTGFLQNAVMTSGETLVLAGFEKELNNESQSGVPGLRALGGKKNTQRGRELTVMMLTSEILPEEPMTVIGDE